VSAHDGFLDLLAERRAAQDAVAEKASALRTRTADHERAVAEHREHVVGVQSGEHDPDPDAEARLYAAVQATGAAVSWKVTNYADVGAVGELVDLQAEAELAGARRRVELAESALRSFARERLADMLGELAARESVRAGAMAEAALVAAQRASAEWNRVYGLFADVCRWADSSDLLKSSPVSPFGGLMPASDVRRGPAPRLVLEDA
jgi:hypothetical protein